MTEKQQDWWSLVVFTFILVGGVVVMVTNLWWPGAAEPIYVGIMVAMLVGGRLAR